MLHPCVSQYQDSHDISQVLARLHKPCLRQFAAFDINGNNCGQLQLTFSNDQFLSFSCFFYKNGPSTAYFYSSFVVFQFFKYRTNPAFIVYFHPFNNRQTQGSGCGSVGRAVASNTRGPRFKSSHRQKFINIEQLLYTINCVLKRRKIKKKRPGPIFKKQQADTYRTIFDHK